MEYFPKDVIRNIVWYVPPKNACIWSWVSKHYFEAIGEFDVYWFHHTKLAKDKKYLVRRIHNPKFTVRCVVHGRTNGACYKFLKDHLAENEFKNVVKDLGFSGLTISEINKYYGDNLWLPYVKLFERLGLDCNYDHHNTIITEKIHTWNEVKYEKSKGDSWFTVFRKIYFTKEKARAKRIAKQIETTNYLQNLRYERDLLRHKLQEVERVLNYAENVNNVLKDIEESSFTRKKISKDKIVVNPKKTIEEIVIPYPKKAVKRIPHRKQCTRPITAAPRRVFVYRSSSDDCED